MLIGLLGWYGHENAGDDRMELALRRLTYPFPTVAIDIGNAGIPLLRQCDFVVVGGGSLFFENNPAAERILHMLRAAHIKNYVIWGVGVDGYSPASKRALTELVDGAVACLVRDCPSQQRVPSSRIVSVAPDLTWTVPYPLGAPVAANQVALNLMPGIDDADAVRIVERLRQSGFELKPWPLCFATEGPDTDPLIAASLSVPTCFMPNIVGECSVAVVMRYHAMVFATQAGTPFVPIAVHPKQYAFLEELEYPIAPVPINSPDEVVERVCEVIRGRETLHSHLLSKRSQLIAAAHEHHSTLGLHINSCSKRALRYKGRRVAKLVWSKAKQITIGSSS